MCCSICHDHLLKFGGVVLTIVWHLALKGFPRDHSDGLFVSLAKC